MNKRLTVLSILTLLVVSLVLPVAAGNMNTGNGSRSGKHYTLNLLGKNWNKGDYADTLENPVMKDDNGHRIFVKLNGKTRIMLQEGPFNVIDADGTDGKAVFQLPEPDIVVDDGGTPFDPSDDIVTSSKYVVYIRMLGKPQGWANMNSGFIDENGNVWISLETIELRQDNSGKVSRKSPPKFVDVTKELTTIFVDITDDETYNPQRYGLFDEELWQYFWDYDNHGLKHVQLRFYPVDI